MDEHRMSDASEAAAAAATANAGGMGGGLGSLADELADAWEEDEEGGYGYEYTSGQENHGPMVDGVQSFNGNPFQSNDSDKDDDGHDNDHDMNAGVRTPSSGYSMEQNTYTLHPPRQKSGGGGGSGGGHGAGVASVATLRHRRHESQYDGSDYGNDSDLEESHISPSLEAQMAEIEGLARRGMENNGSEHDHVIKRAVEALRDLGGQSGIENNAMRLITAHTSITSHLTHQTRALQTLTHPLLFSPFPLLSEDAIDALIPLIDDDLLPTLPYPLPGQSRHSRSQSHSHHTHTSSSATTTATATSSSSTQPGSRSSTPSPSNASHGSTSQQNPLASLQTLISQTSDLTHSLQGLSDTLYESRQLTSTASRRLRSARDLVTELRREEEGFEEGSRWLERGDWDRKLRDRDAGRECGDVVSGFEAVCGEWRERLFGEVVAA